MPQDVYNCVFTLHTFNVFHISFSSLVRTSAKNTFIWCSCQMYLWCISSQYMISFKCKIHWAVLCFSFYFICVKFDYCFRDWPGCGWGLRSHGTWGLRREQQICRDMGIIEIFWLFSHVFVLQLFFVLDWSYAFSTRRSCLQWHCCAKEWCSYGIRI